MVYLLGNASEQTVKLEMSPIYQVIRKVVRWAVDRGVAKYVIQKKSDYLKESHESVQHFMFDFYDGQALAVPVTNLIKQYAHVVPSDEVEVYDRSFPYTKQEEKGTLRSACTVTL